MIKINWNIFKSKFHERERSAFESLAYMLFCYEHNVRIGIFRFKNQVGVETEPIIINNEEINFQAKYYDTKLSENKADIIDSLKKSKSKNPNLNRVLIYTNQEFTESPKKTTKKPKYQIDIEKAAFQLNIEIDWRLSSHFEKQLSVPENHYLTNYFFSLNSNVLDFIAKVKEHSENILFSIQTNIQFQNEEIKVDRSNIISNIDANISQVIILAGDGGSGKTAIIKDLFNVSHYPCYLLKAAEFNKGSVSAIFNDYGPFGMADFLEAHNEEKRKIFVVDSAEKLADLESQDVFIEFLSALIKDGWKILFTTRNSYSDDLSFQMVEVYGRTFEVMRVNNLSETESKRLSSTYKFNVPDDQKIRDLIRNLFYLKEYLANYDVINGKTDYTKFRDILWAKRIQNSIIKKDSIHIERERCFLSLVKERCESGKFFLKGDQSSQRALSALENDEIIKYDQSQDAYFISHDIYEEWALERLIERDYVGKISNVEFFEKIGNSLPIRRAFRSWLSHKIQQADPGITQFIQQAFTDILIPAFWKDELLVSVLLSDYAASFLSTFDKVLLENDKYFLKKVVFLLRTACKQVDNKIHEILQARKEPSVSLAYIFTKPKGKGWEAIIDYLYIRISIVTNEELGWILPLLKDWTNQKSYGKTTRTAGLFALHFYKDAELNDSSRYTSEIEESLLMIVLSAARELKPELITITDRLLAAAYNRQDPFDNLREKILTSNNESVPYIITLPECVIKLGNMSWYHAAEDRHPYNISGIGVEGYYSIRSQWSHYFYPSSALQTPVFYLLRIAFPDAIKFILSFTNKTVEAYFKSGFDPSVHEIEVTVNSVKSKQFISSGLWNIYRGAGSPVTPSLLQSIHMALEKYLLEMSKVTDQEILKNWLIHLLKNTRSASITAVVSSIVLAYPDKYFEVATILFNNYEFLKYDNLRLTSESRAKDLYSIGAGFDYRTREFHEERLATCNDPHRKTCLEGLAVDYQFFRRSGVSEEVAEKRKTEIWEIIDRLKASLPVEELETDASKNIRLLLTRIDRRKMNPTFTYEDNTTIIALNLQLEPDLRKYSEEGLQTFQSKFKYSNLKLWAINIFDSRSQYGPYPQYDDHPETVLKETEEIIEGIQRGNEEFDLFNDQIPGYTCAALIKKYADKLSKKDIKYCSQIVVSYSMAPLRADYRYQIGDGVEAAISSLPFLYKLFPKNRPDYNIILLLILFDTYPLGEYKRVCYYGIEAITNSLYDLSPDDANKILLGYLTFKIKFDNECHPRKLAKERKSRSEILEDFVNKYEAELFKLRSNRTYYNRIDFNKLGIHISETAFQIIPVHTNNPIHLDLVKKILSKYSTDLLSKTDYSDAPGKVDYRLKHRFFSKYARFLLSREIVTIKGWTQPFVDKYVVTREMSEFFSEVVSAEDVLNKYDNFWAIWECFYPVIRSSVLTSNSLYLKEVITNYLLAWPYWSDAAKEWHSLQEREKAFFKRVCIEIGHHPDVLYSISKLLNQIGSSFQEDGIVWIADILSKRQHIDPADRDRNTIYYLEIMIRKYVYLNRTKLKTNRLMKGRVLTLLDFLVSQGSVNGYLLREDIL